MTQNDTTTQNERGYKYYRVCTVDGPQQIKKYDTVLTTVVIYSLPLMTEIYEESFELNMERTGITSAMEMQHHLTYDDIYNKGCKSTVLVITETDCYGKITRRVTVEEIYDRTKFTKRFY